MLVVLKTFRYNLEDGNDGESRNVGQLLTQCRVTSQKSEDLNYVHCGGQLKSRAKMFLFLFIL